MLGASVNKRTPLYSGAWKGSLSISGQHCVRMTGIVAACFDKGTSHMEGPELVTIAQDMVETGMLKPTMSGC